MTGNRSAASERASARPCSEPAQDAHPGSLTPIPSSLCPGFREPANPQAFYKQTLGLCGKGECLGAKDFWWRTPLASALHAVVRLSGP